MATGFKINSDDLDTLFEPAADGVASVIFSNLSPTIKFTAKYNGDNPNAGGYYNYKSSNNTYAYAAQDMWDLNGLIEGKVTTKYLADCSVVASYAFAGCSSLKNVYGPSVITINQNAFQSCNALSSVNFPECTTIGSYVFESCSDLERVFFPKCTTISGGAFYECSNLMTVDFPECTTIGGGAFSDCDTRTINFPKVTTIGYYAFAYNANLSSAAFPECTTIDSRAFQNCDSLSYISLPKCTTIEYYGLMGTNLRTVSLPKITTIEDYAFAYCSSLSTIYIGTSNCSLGYSEAFYSTGITSTTGSIYVPTAYVDAYEHADQWSYFSNRIYGY